MPLKEIILYILGSLATFGVLAGGFGYLWSAIRGGGDKLVEFWKEQANGYKEAMTIKDQQNDTKIRELTEKVGNLTGQLKGTKEYADKLEQIFQNRNPEMVQFMQMMLDHTKQQSAYQNETMKMFGTMVKVLNDIHQSSKSNHQLLEEDKKKDLKIEATITKTPPVA